MATMWTRISQVPWSVPLDHYVWDLLQLIELPLHRILLERTDDMRRRPNTAPAHPASPSVPTNPDVWDLNQPLQAPGADGLAAPVTLVDAIRPIAWIPEPYRVDFGDRIAQTLVMLNLPAQAYTGFMGRAFFRKSQSRRMSWWISPISSEWMLSQLGKRIESLQAQHRGNVSANQAGDARTEPSLQFAHDLRGRIARQETQMFTVSFLVTLLTEGSDAQAWERARAAQKAFLEETRSTMWAFRNAAFNQAEAFWSTTPVGHPAYSIPREVDAETVALMFPFYGGDIIEPEGVLLGIHPGTQAPIMVNWYDRQRYPAAHMIVSAKTRSGKSAAMKYLALQHLLRPDTEVLILDPSRPVDYQRFSETFGTYIRLRPGTTHRINPLEIRYPEFYADLDVEDQQLVDRKIDFLAPLVALMIHPETKGQWANPVERAYVEQVCRRLYAQFGMTNDPRSILDPEQLSINKYQYKRMPILEDLQHAFAAEGDPMGRDIALAMDPFVSGTLNVFNGQTTEDLDQRLITINIESMTSNREDLKSLVHFVVGEVLAQRMLTNDRQKFVILDEAHVLFRNADTAAWAARLYRMAAKSNARVALITQGIRDLVGDDQLQVPGAESAQTCIANSYFQLLLHQSDASELAATARTFHLSPHEVQWLKDADISRNQDPAVGRRGILISNLYHVPLRIRIPDPVLPLVSSDPDVAQERKPDPLGGHRPIMPKATPSS